MSATITVKREHQQPYRFRNSTLIDHTPIFINVDVDIPKYEEGERYYIDNNTKTSWSWAHTFFIVDSITYDDGYPDRITELVVNIVDDDCKFIKKITFDSKYIIGKSDINDKTYDKILSMVPKPISELRPYKKDWCITSGGKRRKSRKSRKCKKSRKTRRRRR